MAGLICTFSQLATGIAFITFTILHSVLHNCVGASTSVTTSHVLEDVDGLDVDSHLCDIDRLISSDSSESEDEVVLVMNLGAM